MEGALEGLRVVEVAEGIAGPYAGKLLADLGAEVITVARPRTGDPCRLRPPFYHDEVSPDSGLLFNSLNTSKLGVTLDVAGQEGRALLLRLLGGADILLVSGSPTEIEERGLAYERMREVATDLVCAYVTPFGLEGPYRERKAGELVAFQMSGLGFPTPRDRLSAPGRRPLKAGGNQALMASGLTAAVAVMHALFAREATGRGQLVDVSEVEPLSSFQFLNLARWWYAGDAGERGYGEGSRRIFCADGAVSFLLFTGQQQQWQAFRELIGDPEWFDERYRPPISRVPEDDPLWAHLHEWGGNYTKEQIYREGQGRRVPVFPENTVAEAIESDQVKARGFVREIELANGARAGAPSAPYQMSETPAGPRGPVPSLGRDNDQVYRGRLGLSEEELLHARQTGVV